MKRPVVFVGLMGAGKSAIGSRIADHLNLPFFDTDQEIETKEGKSVTNIFSDEGETYFRQREYEVISSLLSSKEPSIISTGGGAYIQPDTRALINEKAAVVWLKATLDVLVERTERKQNRPLLEQGDKSEILAKLMEERYPIYAEAGYVVDTDHRPHEVVVEKVLEIITQEEHA